MKALTHVKGKHIPPSQLDESQRLLLAEILAGLGGTILFLFFFSMFAKQYVLVKNEIQSTIVHS